MNITTNPSLAEVPEQPTEQCKFKRGDEVFLINEKTKARAVNHYDFESCIRIADGKGERIVRGCELMLLSEREAELERAREEIKNMALKKERDSVSEVVRLWHSGCKTHTEMSKATGKKPIFFLSKISKAKRLGLIGEKQQAAE